MSEHDGPTWRDLGIQAAVVFGIAAAAGGIAIYKGSHTDITSAANDTDRDGRPALAQGTYNNDVTVAPTTAQGGSATNSSNSTGPNCETTPPGHITNYETCADYKVVQDPIPGKDRFCVEKGSYTEANKRTLYGMRRVVGIGEVEIIDPSTREIIGFFAQGVQASFEAMVKPAMEDAVACSNN